MNASKGESSANGAGKVIRAADKQAAILGRGTFTGKGTITRADGTVEEFTLEAPITEAEAASLKEHFLGETPEDNSGE